MHRARINPKSQTIDSNDPNSQFPIPPEQCKSCFLQVGWAVSQSDRRRKRGAVSVGSQVGTEQRVVSTTICCCCSSNLTRLLTASLRRGSRLTDASRSFRDDDDIGTGKRKNEKEGVCWMLTVARDGLFSPAVRTPMFLPTGSRCNPRSSSTDFSLQAGRERDEVAMMLVAVLE